MAAADIGYLVQLGSKPNSFLNSRKLFVNSGLRIKFGVS